MGSDDVRKAWDQMKYDLPNAIPVIVKGIISP